MSGFASPATTPKKRRLAPFTPNSACSKISPSLECSLAVTPEEKISRYRSKHSVASIFAASSPTSVSFPAALLPTPSTVGSGRSKSHDLVVPSKKSRSLTACLQALSDETTCPVPSADYSPGLKIQYPEAVEPTSSPGLKLLLPSAVEPFETSRRLDASDSTISCSSNPFEEKCLKASFSPEASEYPSTPPQLTIKQESLFEAAQPEEKGVEIITLCDVEKIPRQELSNPFLEKKTPNNSEKPSNAIDFSDTIQLINHTSGQRKLQRMSEDQKRFKPRKLVFTEEPSRMKVNYNVTNKFIGKCIGKNFTLHDAPGLAPGFEIYDDNNADNSSSS